MEYNSEGRTLKRLKQLERVFWHSREVRSNGGNSNYFSQSDYRDAIPHPLAYKRISIEINKARHYQNHKKVGHNPAQLYRSL